MSKITDYDYSKLLGRMREKGYTQIEVCKRMRMSETTLNLTLGNKRPFRQTEISKLCSILEIPMEDVAFRNLKKGAKKIAARKLPKQKNKNH